MSTSILSIETVKIDEVYGTARVTAVIDTDEHGPCPCEAVIVLDDETYADITTLFLELRDPDWSPVCYD